MRDENLEGKRAAFYIRVSTEEQALRGYSLEAQLADLEAFAKENFMVITDHYIDAGTTARKKLKNRKEFQRMLSDVRADKIDIILFIKLDRWFRNVADYYEVQKVLDAHNVTWKCTQEFYDTTTANGRLNLNIKLSIAQDESDRTSERIKFVFENKVKNNEVISGSLHFGFYIKKENGKKVVAIDEEKMEIVKNAFDYFLFCNSIRKTCFYIYEKYGINWVQDSFKRMIFDDMYAGIYRDNKNYCPAAFSIDYMKKLRSVVPLQTFSRTGKVYCYLFSGLVKCSLCDHNMTANKSERKYGTYIYYRCKTYLSRRTCSNIHGIQEKIIERYLLNNIRRIMKECIFEYEITDRKVKKPNQDKQKIKTKMRKLKDLYLNDLIDLNEYRKDYEAYRKELDKLESVRSPEVNIGRLQRILSEDFIQAYETLDREHKRSFWRSFIKTIYVNDNKEVVRIVFL